MRSLVKAAAVALCVSVGPAGAAPADPLVVDLSSHMVAITTGFTGTDVLLFGATQGEGHVVVVVEGPHSNLAVRRKDRVVGIWVNSEEVTFRNVPTFYQVKASDLLDEWLPLRLRERHQIGVEYLNLEPITDVGPAMAADFRAALIRNKQRMGHYGEFEGEVTVIGGRLFRTEVFFPANVPTGAYAIRVLLVRNGAIISQQTTPLLISKSGIGAEIYRMAHANPALYGVAAILVAVLAGLAANAAFRKV